MTFIRPLLEYGDIVWDNCTQYEKQELDKIQNEAARIGTGTTKLVSINSLYNEICRETLERRRYNHKMTLFYKMMYNITPLFLSSLVPPSISNVSRYNLRNSNDLQTIDARTSQYLTLFCRRTTYLLAQSNVNIKTTTASAGMTFNVTYYPRQFKRHVVTSQQYSRKSLGILEFFFRL